MNERLKRLCGGRVAFVSGASRGIGAGVASRFQDLGMNLVLCSRTQPSLAAGNNVIAHAIDVRDEEAMGRLVAEAESRFGTIDLWVNNAGVLDPIAPVRDVSVEDFREHLDINLVGLFVGSKAYVNHLHARDATGVLINVSSGAAAKAYHGWGAYCAGKAGVERLTEVLDLEESPRLRAYAIAPGVVDTEMQSKIRETPKEQFPDVDRFLELKQNEAFAGTEYIADEFAAVAFDEERLPLDVALRL